MHTHVLFNAVFTTYLYKDVLIAKIPLPAFTVQLQKCLTHYKSPPQPLQYHYRCHTNINLLPSPYSTITDATPIISPPQSLQRCPPTFLHIDGFLESSIDQLEVLHKRLGTEAMEQPSARREVCCVLYSCVPIHKHTFAGFSTY